MLADRLHYAASVGTGFSERVARDLKARLDKLASQTPIISTLRINGAMWCLPELKAEIAYRAVTRKGELRHASFKGLIEE